MECIEKEVDFNKYCPLCKFAADPESEDPCCECLGYPSNMESRKPVNWEEK